MSYPGPDDQQQYPQYGSPGAYPSQSGAPGPYPAQSGAPGPYPSQSGAPGPYPSQYPSAPPGYGGYPPPRRNNGMAIAGLVCGLVGLLVFWFVLGPLAIIFGGIGLSRANRGAPGRGMAIAGIALGVVDVVVYLILLLVLVSSHKFVI